MDSTSHIDRSVIPFDALGDWMDEQGLPAGEFTAIEPLGGGTQNVMIRFQRGGRDFVLRRGPRHLRPKSNDAIRRESRVLAALADTDVPAPRPIAACPDESVIGAAFYLMEPVNGFNPTTRLPDLHRADARVRHQMGLTVVDALARLGAVDHEAVGLGDVGHPDGFLRRQVPQWLSTLDAYGGPVELPNVASLADWLEDNLPAEWKPGIMHGDFHLANVMYSYDGPQIAAIVDWEMCTVGDPLLDLGWLLATWPDEGDLSLASGLPGRAELVARYAENSSRDTSFAAWYAVLASFKLAIVLEGTHVRARAGKAPQDVGDYLHGMAVRLLDRAPEFAEKGV